MSNATDRILVWQAHPGGVMKHHPRWTPAIVWHPHTHAGSWCVCSWMAYNPVVNVCMHCAERRYRT